jgi:hypothetical protein
MFEVNTHYYNIKTTAKPIATAAPRPALAMTFLAAAAFALQEPVALAVFSAPAVN